MFMSCTIVWWPGGLLRSCWSEIVTVSERVWRPGPEEAWDNYVTLAGGDQTTCHPQPADITHCRHHTLQASKHNNFSDRQTSRSNTSFIRDAEHKTVDSAILSWNITVPMLYNKQRRFSPYPPHSTPHPGQTREISLLWRWSVRCEAGLCSPNLGIRRGQTGLGVEWEKQNKHGEEVIKICREPAFPFSLYWLEEIVRFHHHHNTFQDHKIEIKPA